MSILPRTAVSRTYLNKINYLVNRHINPAKVKQFSCLILPGFLLAVSLNAQNIQIPDQCFINALIENGVDSNEDGLISYAEAEAVEILDFWSECITDLKGIEAFLNLTHLYFSTVNVKSVDLSANTKLTRLVISGQFDTLDLSNNPLVDTLISYGGRISFLDVSQCRNLRRLSIQWNKLSALDLSHNTELTYLDCGDNLLTELDLSSCPELYRIDCSYNLIKQLDLSANKKLKSLSCSNNQLSNLDLSNLDSLNRLSSQSNYLHSLDLSSAPLLEYLSCSDNHLWHLDVSGNVHLRMLNCGGNPMTALNISNNQALDTLSIGYGVPSLAINHMPSLKQVCVWELPFPPPGFIMDTIGSPNITFTTECVLGLQSEPEQRISVFPNPARNWVKIRADWPGEKALTLLTSKGTLIQRISFKGDEYHLDISGLPAGIYIATVHSSKQMLVGKIIKY